MAWSNGLGLTQLIKAHTRNAKSSASMIDLVFTNMDHCNNSGVLDLVLSDHLPVYVIRKKIKDVRRQISVKGRTYVNYSKDLLSDALTNDIKSSFRREEDPNACWDGMGDFLNSFLDAHCPIKTFRSKENTPA